ncbi:MAG: biopolymer transport protein ExbB/TolQ [Myxococcota bacterium]|jgi:biopolymer transport protein ExbB/TolQ
MSDRTCPHCGHQSTSPDSHASGIVDCASCDRSFAIVGHYERSGPASANTPSLAYEVSRGEDAPLAKSGAIALAASLLLYGALETPLGDTYFGQLLSARGWVPYVIALFSLWAFAILGLKWQRHREQADALALELLPVSIGLQIDQHNASIFREYLHQVATLRPGNALIARLDWAMRRIAKASAPKDLALQLSERSRLDADILDSSYTMLRVFIWAIPILGFIGTVLGISESVSGFSNSVNSAASLDVMRQSIGSVTTGLGVAFDTTLLALVMSILIMFPMSALQKAEETFLAGCDGYCDTQLLSRLAKVVPGEVVSEAIAPNVGQLLERLEARIAQLEPGSAEA